MSVREVVIVGAGIGGLATAIALDQVGVQVEVYERAPELGEVGAGLSLWPNAMEALDRLKVGDATREASVSMVGGVICRPDGKVLVDEVSLAHKAGYDDPARMIHRARLHEILLDRWGRPVHTGHECVGVDQTADRASVQFANDHSAAGDLVIGADGLHSRVRAQVVGDVKPRFSGYTAWRAVVHYDRDRLLPSEGWGLGARFGIAPLPGGNIYWYATKNTAEAADATGDERGFLLGEFGDWYQPVGDLISLTDERAILRHAVYDRPPLRRWVDGPLVLIGDAAHPMTPNLGQGACQAIEDAVTLASCLAGAPERVAALRQFQKLRVRHVGRLVRKARAIGRVGQWERKPLVTLRDTVLARL